MATRLFDFVQLDAAPSVRIPCDCRMQAGVRRMSVDARSFLMLPPLVLATAAHTLHALLPPQVGLPARENQRAVECVGLRPW